MAEQRHVFRPTFWITPTLLSDDPCIEPFDEKVYAAIDWFHNMKDGECRASNNTLAILIKPSDPQPRSVQNSLIRLETQGYIRREYKDEAHRNRLRIVPLIVMKVERTVSDRRKPSETAMIDVRNGDDRASETAMTRVITVSNKRSKKVPARGAEDEIAIGEVIDSFKDVNPTFKLLFARTNQREAAWRLLEQFGMPQVKKMVKFLEHSNAAKFAPTITTPSQLESKLGELKAWADKQRRGSGKGIINAASGNG